MIGPAYTLRQLQDARTLLDELSAQGLTTLAEARAAINAALPPPDTVIAPPRPSPMPPCPTRRPDGTPCPGTLQPVSNREGLTILGCRLCRYSEVR